MINKIGKVTVYVEDQEQAKDFWLNKMGFVLKLSDLWAQMHPGLKWDQAMMNLQLWYFIQRRPWNSKIRLQLPTHPSYSAQMILNLPMNK